MILERMLNWRESAMDFTGLIDKIEILNVKYAEFDICTEIN